MPDFIHLLPDSVANQIAAGEVIQRPSSVVKELVENAVDAGARHIDLLVEEAGRTSIMVVDDGKGMSETDARLAFERHATSKIREAADLFSLRTMGFRGEALPSIAAVSQVTLKTHAQDQALGTCLTLEGGRVTSQEIDACPVGSSFLVQNIFFNVPARRKFLKSNQTELSNIIQEYERIVLVNPDIQFTFHSNGQLQSTYTPGSLRQRVTQVAGRKLGDALLDVEVDTSLCRISGFVGRPDMARRRGVPQYFFVNGRYMRHPYFQKAVLQAFDNLIPATEQVPFFLYFTVDPSTIDVNIHPTKTAIKFENEQAIWQIILAAVKEALGKFNVVPTIEFDTEAETNEIPVFSGQPTFGQSAPAPRVDVSYNPFTAGTTPRRPASVPQWQTLYSKPETEENLFPEQPAPAFERSHTHLQYRGRYILTETSAGLMVVDQRRAHVRVLYNRYMQQGREHRGASQQLLFPEMLQFSPADASLVTEIADELSAFGFDITSLGGTSFSLQGVPADLHGQDMQRLFAELLTSLREEGNRPDEELSHRLALTMARSAAITVGQVLSQEEMEHLLVELLDSDNPNLTPDGKPVIAVIAAEDVDKRF